MPRDPTGVRPQGALFRHPADWFSDNLYSASWWEMDPISGTGDMYIAIAVANDDNRGRVLRVWGVTAFAEGGGGLALFFVNGHTGAQVATAQNLRPDYPPQLISVWSQHQQVAFGAPNPFNFGNQYSLIGAPGFDSGTVPSPFPLAIIPVGWSLVGTSIQSSPVLGFSLWLELATR